VKAVVYDAIAEPPQLARLKRAAEEAHLRIPIAGIYPLEQAAQAHAAVERGHVHGRIVLRIRDEPAG
jgi:NADPH:quinone reductase-like Zn-dependent oxidoreductase